MAEYVSWEQAWAMIWSRFDRIDRKLNQLLVKETEMAVDVTALTAEVERNSSVTASVVQLIDNLVTQLSAIPPSSDPTTQAALDALKATLSGNDDVIAAKVAANTPAA